MIEVNGKRLVIDTGPDFRYQMLRAGVKDIRAVLLTHGHKDHIAGLDDMRAFNWVNKQAHKGAAVDIYSDARTQEVIYREFGYAFAEDKYPGVPTYNLHVIDTKPFFIDDIEVIPLPVVHYELVILGFRIGNFAYITDVSHIPDDTMEKLKGVEYMVLDALREEPHVSHLTLSQAVDILQKLQVKQGWFTHIGHQMGLSKDFTRKLPANIRPAYDEMVIDIS
ncbi:hydrolase [Bacteroidia bacterium]|nr:hydrolase [Bacteroidia bacterium]